MTHRTDSEIAPELREAVTQFLVPLKTMQPVDVRAFERLHTLVIELMHTYKGSDRVSKSLLHELYAVPLSISAELEIVLACFYSARRRRTGSPEFRGLYDHAA
jgi:hypothetical protein